jgi:hypothetical protein
MPYDVRRLRGFAAALLAVLAGLACHGLALRATLGRMGPWIELRGQTFNISTSPENALRRVVGIRRDLTSGTRPASGERLGIMIGSSTLKQGVDPAILDAEAGGGYRWTNVHCGQAFEDLLVVRAMYRSGLKPAALGLVTNPGLLVADSHREAERGWYDPGPFLGYLKARQLQMAREELVALTMAPWNLAFPYRGRVFTLADRGLFVAKSRMLEALGQGPEALVAPEPDPWLNPFPADAGQGTPEGNEKVLKFIGIKGWYDPANYRADGPNFDALVEIFRTAHEEGTRTFLVFVPESSTYRAKLPPTAADHFEKTLTLALGDAAPAIFDFREAAPEEDFADVNHLNASGREHFSHRVADALRRLLVGEGGRPGPSR